MSWNGATEVSRWLLEGFENNDEEEKETTGRRSRPSRTNRRNNSVEKISLVAKEGFETIYRISSKAISHKTRFVRVVALDRDDKVLGISDLMDLRGMNRDNDDKGIIDNSQQGEEEKEKGEKNFPFKLTNTDILLISFVGLLISLSFKFIFGFTAIGGRGRGRRRGGSKDKDKEMQEQDQQDKKKEKKQKSKYKYSLLLQ